MNQAGGNPEGAEPNAARPDHLAQAAEVIRLEARTIESLLPLLDERFEDAVERILASDGSLVVTGVGKARLVGAKLSATFASTGTPSIALHPTEALHGDLGRIQARDVVLAISNSGETEEVKALIPHVRRIGACVIAMTGQTESTLARMADVVLDIGRVDEACPFGLAPTASTSAMMALGDALAMVVLSARGFSREDYARFHPGGSLGRKLMRVKEVMRRGEELPLVSPKASVREVLLTMSETPGRPGAALVVDGTRTLCGIFTDGDLRRLLEADATGALTDPVESHMGRSPKTVRGDALVADAERLLREHKIDQIAVVDEGGCAVGLLDVQDLLDTRA
ncbi:MAG TPA: KpsF/GutQ family sugar-phosphate isomerase [Planctomycetes bacterium]|nr:KpsF/GutQ family sugar-phosphate isomerase [Planctomycetota bacterium]